MNTSSERRSLLTARLELSATILLIVVALLVGGLTVWDRVHPQAGRAAIPEPPLPTDPVSIDDAPIRGDRKAKVALIEFSEFECPYCGKSAREVMPEINRKYVATGKVVLAWRHYPLPIHKQAQKAAEAAECAGRQGQFWAFHDWAFQHQQELDEANIRQAAHALQLDSTAFAACLRGQAVAKVQADVDLANAVSISGTPTWLIGVVQPAGKVRVTGRLSGAKPLAEFEKLINVAIATVEGPRKRE